MQTDLDGLPTDLPIASWIRPPIIDAQVSVPPLSHDKESLEMSNCVIGKYT